MKPLTARISCPCGQESQFPRHLSWKASALSQHRVLVVVVAVVAIVAIVMVVVVVVVVFAVVYVALVAPAAAALLHFYLRLRQTGHARVVSARDSGQPRGLAPLSSGWPTKKQGDVAVFVFVAVVGAASALEVMVVSDLS